MFRAAFVIGCVVKQNSNK